MKPPKGEELKCGNCDRVVFGKANVIKENHDGTLWVRCGVCVAKHREATTDNKRALTS